MDELWDTALNKIIKVIHAQLVRDRSVLQPGACSWPDPQRGCRLLYCTGCLHYGCDHLRSQDDDSPLHPDPAGECGGGCEGGVVSVLNPFFPQGYGYNVARLYETLLQVRDRYTTVLMQQCAGTFKRLFRNDNCAPLEVADEDEYREVIQHFPYDDRVLVEVGGMGAVPCWWILPRTM